MVGDLGAMRCPACAAELKRIHGTPHHRRPGAPEAGDEWSHRADCDVYWRLDPPTGWEWLVTTGDHPWQDTARQSTKLL